MSGSYSVEAPRRMAPDAHQFRGRVATTHRPPSHPAPLTPPVSQRAAGDSLDRELERADAMLALLRLVNRSAGVA